MAKQQRIELRLTDVVMPLTERAGRQTAARSRRYPQSHPRLRTRGGYSVGHSPRAPPWCKAPQEALSSPHDERREASPACVRARQGPPATVSGEASPRRLSRHQREEEPRVKLRDLKPRAGMAPGWPPRWVEFSGPSEPVAEEGVLEGIERLGTDCCCKSASTGVGARPVWSGTRRQASGPLRPCSLPVSG